MNTVIHMRKGMLALGLCLLLLGLICVSLSRVVQSEPPRWVPVASERGSSGVDSLAVQGNLTTGDTWQIYFAVRFTQQQVTMDEGVAVTLTDPSNNVLSYDIPIYAGPMPEYFPQGIANESGLYKVNVTRYGLFTRVTQVELRKMEPGEQRYPYGFLLYIGVVIFGGGAGISIIGSKSAKTRRSSSKQKSL